MFALRTSADAARADRERDDGRCRVHLVVEALGPEAGRVPLPRVCRPHRRIREGVVEVLVDQRRLDQHRAVVHQRRHHVLPVERDVFRVVLRPGDQVDLVRDELEILLGEDQAHLLRACRESEVVEFQHCVFTSVSRPSALRRAIG
jgi:hypothetical protein